MQNLFVISYHPFSDGLLNASVDDDDISDDFMTIFATVFYFSCDFIGLIALLLCYHWLSFEVSLPQTKDVRNTEYVQKSSSPVVIEV